MEKTVSSILPSPLTFSRTNFPERSHNCFLKSRSPFSLPFYKSKLGSFATHLHRNPKLKPERRFKFFAMAAAVASYTKEELPPSLDATAEPPSLFDGTTRLYISYVCPFAQRTWIARNYKGLQDKIKLVPIDLQNRPAWYKEKVYSVNKVPSLEHNNEVKGESLDLLKYIDEHFEGPSLLPDDPEKKKLAEELLAFTDSFNGALYRDLPAKGGVSEEVDAAFNKIEEHLSKFDDGPFFLGQFSLVDIAYAPFIERFQLLFADIKNYDITKGRPKLALWIEELNKIDAYSHTRINPQELIATTKKRFGIN
ncbi:protein IN2-1 homolog B-like isoform X2 [Dendrobium catenatum]|uniref:Protein IN2-1 like B n=1 Tax=Dendrobium catenatum TaxID=906689 RepID=A0A2I0XJ45_9ASPA|nr:protein IN2-1 homolog B-like isoform X2 [Dendrobium catenatum]PKU87943.1 Protein IN2-1 like B [Dendrobium catenatum]